MTEPDLIAEQFDRGRAAADRVLAARAELTLDRATDSYQPSGLLVAEGDSWFSYPFYDVLGALQDDFNWEIQSVARAGDRLEDMVYDDPGQTEFCRKLEWIQKNNKTPHAVLLSAGGNDIAGPECRMLLEHAGSGDQTLNTTILNEVINNRLRKALAHMVSALAEHCDKKFRHTIPVIMHGYGHPVPDGRGFLSGWGPLPGPWMSPGFSQKGIADLSERKKIAATIVDMYNTMVEDLSRQPNYIGRLLYVDVRDTLSSGAQYKKWWADELHPTRQGFHAVAEKIDQRIRQFPASGD